MTAPVNRYRQLLSLVPSGSFYASDGQVLPHRSTPYQLRLVADEPNQMYYVFLNDQLATSITSDANSIATLSLLLVKGGNAIKLVNSVTQAPIRANITTRDYATWMAALASVIESIDEDIEQVLSDSRLATASLAMIDEVFGKTVESKNDFVFDLESYRELLQEARAAFRHYGGTDGGIERVVRAFYHISPLLLDRSLAQSWKLGADLLYPTNRSSAIQGPLTAGGLVAGLNVSGATVTAKNPGIKHGNDTHQFDYKSSGRQVAYKPPAGTTGSVFYGPYTSITADGDYVLNGVISQKLMSSAETFNITAANAALSLEVDNRGELVISLPVSGTLSAATLTAAINAAFNASPLYGVAYATVASTATAAPESTSASRVFLQSPTGGVVLVRKTPSTFTLSAAASAIFDMPHARLEITGAITPGDTILPYTINSLSPAFPDSIPTEGIWALLDSQAPYTTVRGAYVGTTPVSNQLERVLITGINKTASQVTISAATKVHSAKATLYPESDATLSSINYTRPITLTIANYGSLPAIDTTGSTSQTGTQMPANWLFTSAAGAPVALNGPCYESVLHSADDFVFRMVSDRRITIPVPNVAKYAGFSLSLYVHAFHRTAANAALLENFQVSYDNGASWVALTATKYGLLNESMSVPETYKATFVVVPGTVHMLVRFSSAVAAQDNIMIQRVSIIPESLATGYFLGAGTVPNNEMRLKTGKALFWWSNEPATASEKAALGLASSTQDIIGHVDRIAPDFAWLDKYDVTEFTGTVPKNVAGAFTDANFSLGTAVNMAAVLRTPSRMSFMQSTTMSEQTQALLWTTVGPYDAILSIASTQNLLNATMYVDGIPLTQDEWQFVDATTVRLLTTPVATSVYTITYEAEISFTTAAVDLGATYADYLWYTDAHSFVLPRPTAFASEVTYGVQFDSAGVAVLLDQSNGDKSTAAIIEDTGFEVRTVPVTQWSFVDNTRIQMNPSAISVNSVYSFRYTAMTSHIMPAANEVFEYRCATSSVGLAAAAWNTMGINTPAPAGFRYFQLRVKYTGVEDVRAVRLQSLLLKGLNMFGVGGTVPILRP